MRWLINFVRQDFIRKMVALLLAIMFYFGISTRITVEKQLIDVPVQVVLSNNLYSEQQTYPVNILIRGPERVLNDLSANDISGQVEVTENHQVRDGVYEVALTPGDFSLPNGVKVVRSGKLSLQLQRIVSRKLLVQAKYQGNLSQDLSVTDTRIRPGEVEASGPELMLESLSNITTEPIPLSSEVIESFAFDAKLQMPEEPIRLNRQQVNVETVISRKMTQREFRRIPVLLGDSGGSGLKFEFTSKGNTVDVVTGGTPSQMEKLSANDITAIVDVSKVKSTGLVVLPVICTINADGVTARQIYPAEIEVKATKIK